MKYINNFVLKSDAIAASDVVSPDVSYCIENNQLLMGVEGLSDETSLKIVFDGPDRLKYFIPYDYLAFTCVSDGGISMTNYGDNLPNVEYSKNGGDWVEWDYINIPMVVGDVVMMRGNNPDGFSYNSIKYSGFIIEGKFNLSGNIMTLIDGVGETMEIPHSPSCFCRLFKNQAGILTCCKLPATTLYGGCYFSLFQGTGIVDASKLELPAMTMTYSTKSVMETSNDIGCYHQMFMSCSSLINAPKLPATTLANYCYYLMFSSCGSLVNVPELSVTTLADSCYYGLFDSCTSLVTAPELSATALTESCYGGMFYGCSNLVTAPELPATILANGCYSGMFYNCSKLVNVQSVLPATALAQYCYNYMFYGCSSLAIAPDLPALTLPVGVYNGPTTHGGTWGNNYGCYSYMFFGCTGLTKAPVLSAQTLTEGCYVAMFSRCSSLMEITCLATSIAIENENDFVSKHAAVINFMYGMNSNAVLKVPTGMKAEWEKTDNYYQNYKTIVEI